MLIVLYTEVQDNKCSNIYFNGFFKDSCRPGDGPFRDQKPLPTDDCPLLFTKINEAANYDQNSVKWRRALIYGSIISVLLWTLVILPQGGMPNIRSLVLTILISSFVLYFMFNYYSYHVSSIPASYVKQAVDLVQQKCIVK